MAKDEGSKAAPASKQKPAEPNQRDRTSGIARPANGDFDPFWLTRVYPEAHGVFEPTNSVDPNSSDVIIALDTNALLVPYQMRGGDLAGLSEVYSKLFQEGRLFLPEQVPREFIKHRDSKLAEIVKDLEDRTSRLEGAGPSVSNLFLEDFAAQGELAKAETAYKKTVEIYAAQLKSLAKHMRAWRGTDPVMKLYAGIFNAKRMVGPGIPDDDVIKRLEYGIRHKVPPGYKDSGKDDQGIGDVLIWLSLLNLGETHKKDLVFVTGEEKADWFVRSNNKPLYPRPELVDEYRRRSGGRSLRLSSLKDLLEEMRAPKALVAKVEAVEETANSAFQVGNMRHIDIGEMANILRRKAVDAMFYGGSSSVLIGQATFDYSSHDGELHILRDGFNFTLAFSKASDTSIYILKRGNTQRIARVKPPFRKAVISIADVDTTSQTYTLQIGDVFLIENLRGAVLAGRISVILDDTRGADRDEVMFDYTISPSNERICLPS